MYIYFNLYTFKQQKKDTHFENTFSKWNINCRPKVLLYASIFQEQDYIHKYLSRKRLYTWILFDDVQLLSFFLIKDIDEMHQFLENKVLKGSFSKWYAPCLSPTWILRRLFEFIFFLHNWHLNLPLFLWRLTSCCLSNSFVK